MAEEEGMTITLKKQDLWKYSTFLLVAVLIVGGFFVLTNDKTPTGNVVNNPTGNTPGTTAPVEVSVDDDPMIGDKDAPVTIVEFSDFECPFCGRFFLQTYPQLKKEYIDTGKVKLVFRDFPLGFHPFAQPAAEAAECVRKFGGDEAYFKMHDKIFANQESLSEANLKLWASEITGADISACLANGEKTAEVQKDLQDGQAYGVGGTPSFFVDGIMIEGAQPFSAFKQVIDGQLAKA